MSLQTSRIYGLFFFLSTLALASCEKPTDIGLNLPGQNPVGTSYDNSRSISASTTIQADSIVAFKSNPVLVGQATDGELGNVSATHYTEVSLNGTALNFNVNASAQADSLVLVLAYTGYYYGDTTANLIVNVNKLEENFINTKTYYTNTPFATGNLLGTKTFKPKYNRVSKSVTTGNSAQTVTFSRLLRIKLDKNFADELLRKSGTSELSTQDLFRQYWKGIAISSSAGNSIIGLSTLPDSAGTLLGRVAGINLYYHNKNNQAQYHNFALSGEYYYNGIKGMQAGGLSGLKAGAEAFPAQTGNVTYIQENTGVKTRLTFPDLAAFKAEKGNIFINYAELVIPVAPNTVNGGGKVSKAPEAIFLYESTTSNRVSKTTGGISYAVQAGNASPFGFSRPNRSLYVADSGFYKANVTSYIQALLDGRKPNNGIIVSPQAEDAAIAKIAGVSFPGTVTTNRALLNPAKMKLRIYYSKLN